MVFDRFLPPKGFTPRLIIFNHIFVDMVSLRGCIFLFLRGIILRSGNYRLGKANRLNCEH